MWRWQPRDGTAGDFDGWRRDHGTGDDAGADRAGAGKTVELAAEEAGKSHKRRGAGKGRGITGKTERTH